MTVPSNSNHPPVMLADLIAILQSRLKTRGNFPVQVERWDPVSQTFYYEPLVLESAQGISPEEGAYIARYKGSRPRPVAKLVWEQPK